MSNITFAPFPIPVVTPLGSGYIVYISPNPIHENDEITVAMDEDGQYRHFNSGQVRAYRNATYGINAEPKESYTEEWMRKFNEGITIPPSSGKWVGTKDWDDMLVAEFTGYCEAILKGEDAPSVDQIMSDFKLRKGIK